MLVSLTLALFHSGEHHHESRRPYPGQGRDLPLAQPQRVPGRTRAEGVHDCCMSLSFTGVMPSASRLTSLVLAGNGSIRKSPLGRAWGEGSTLVLHCVQEAEILHVYSVGARVRPPNTPYILLSLPIPSLWTQWNVLTPHNQGQIWRPGHLQRKAHKGRTNYRHRRTREITRVALGENGGGAHHFWGYPPPAVPRSGA